MKRLVVDLATRTEQYVDMTPEEIASVNAACTEAAQARAAEEAAAADRAAARQQLKQIAKGGGNVPAAVLARALGIDPNS